MYDVTIIFEREKPFTTRLAALNYADAKVKALSDARVCGWVSRVETCDVQEVRYG